MRNAAEVGHYTPVHIFRTLLRRRGSSLSYVYLSIRIDLPLDGNLSLMVYESSWSSRRSALSGKGIKISNKLNLKQPENQF